MKCSSYESFLTIAAIYGADGRLHRRFLSSTKKVLARMAGLADELQHTFPIHLDKTYSGLSRSSASLHLLYHQVTTLHPWHPVWHLTSGVVHRLSYETLALLLSQDSIRITGYLL